MPEWSPPDDRSVTHSGEIGFDGDTSRAVTVRASTAVSLQTIRRDALLSTLGYDLDADVCTPITPWRPPDRPTHPLRLQSRRAG